MSNITQQMIEIASNPANQEIAGQMLSETPSNSSKIFQGIEGYVGEQFVGDMNTFEYRRKKETLSLVVQDTTEGINPETTIIKNGSVTFIAVHATIDSATNPIHINQQVDAWEYENGRRIALTPEMLYAKTLVGINESRTVSHDLLLWQTLKTGVLPDAKSWANTIIKATGNIATWNGYNFFELWKTARPTGEGYALSDGFNNIDFSIQGAVFAFTENVQETFLKKNEEGTSPLSINEGATVLLGKTAWSEFIKSPDLKSLALHTNPQFHALSRMEIVGTMIQKVEVNGVIFMRKNWSQKLDYQGHTLTFNQMSAKEILCLPNVDFSIVDLIKFNVKDITSSTTGWSIPSSELVWVDIAKDRTKMDIGVRGSVGYGNKFPEMALLGTHV